MTATLAIRVGDAYAERVGEWTGVNRTTAWGPWGWDLEGATADQLRADADTVRRGGEILWCVERNSNGREADCSPDAVAEALEQAAEYIERVVAYAGAADRWARRAFDHAQRGNWQSAVKCAELARDTEGHFGAAPTWGPFAELVAACADAARTNIPDGIYYVYPEGSSWEAVEVRNGRLIDRTEASLADDHLASGDEWAGVVPSAGEEHVDQDVADAVALLAGYDPGAPVTVTRAPDCPGC